MAGERQIKALEAEGDRGVSLHGGGAGACMNALEEGIQGIYKGLTPRGVDLTPLQKGFKEVA